MILDWRKELTRDGSRITLSGLHMAMHCHHYNINLEKMLDDTMGEKGCNFFSGRPKRLRIRGLNPCWSNSPPSAPSSLNWS